MKLDREIPPTAPLSDRDWHVLVALSVRSLHGYGIMKAVEQDSGGTVSAEIGSLYRILGRLMDDGFVNEGDPPPDAPEETRGRPRRYYELTDRGRVALGEESLRLQQALKLAHERCLVPEISK